MLQSPDFVAAVAGRGTTTSTFAYAGNNPLKNIDPTGLVSVDSDTSRALGGKGWAVRWQNIIKKAQERAANEKCRSFYRRMYNAEILKLLRYGHGPKLRLTDFHNTKDANGKAESGSTIAWYNPFTDWIAFDADLFAARTEDELAGDLLHELGHYANRHAFWPLDEDPRAKLHGGANLCVESCP